MQVLSASWQGRWGEVRLKDVDGGAKPRHDARGAGTSIISIPGIRLRVQAWLFAALLSCLPLVAIHAEGVVSVPVRVGSHPGYGRVVFDLPARSEYSLTQQGQHVVVQFTGAMTIGSSTVVQHNVLAVTGGAGQAEFDVAPNTVLRDSWFGNHLVIDVWDRGAAPNLPPAATQAAQRAPANGAAPATNAATGTGPPASANAAAPAPPPVAPATAGAVTAAPPTKAPGAGPPPPGKVPPTALPTVLRPAAPVTAGAIPAASPPKPVPSPNARKEAPAAALAAPQTEAPPRASPDASVPSGVTQPPAAQPPQPAADAPADSIADAAQPAPKPGSTMTVPFDTPLGIAAFRRGNSAIVVFDQQRTIDTASLQDDPVFGTATVQVLPTATVMRVQLEAGMVLSLSQAAKAWRITAVPVAPALRPITTVLADNRLVITALAPSAVVTLADPDTGATLLIGTQLRSGQGVPVRRHAVEFALLPTWQGIVVEAIADTLTLRPTQQGFALTSGPRALALSPAPDAADLLANTAGLTRQFEFPNQPTVALLQRLRREVAEDATTAPLGRGPRRQAVARTMISLGLGPEAQAVLHLAAADDPHEAASADNAALASIAALVAHRPNDAAGLNDPRIPAADDVALWRALRRAELQQGSAAAAAVFTATLPLLLAYPSELRNRLLPLVAETLVAGGETTIAGALFDALKGDATLDLARGLLQEALGNGAAALAIYDRLAQSRDQSLHAQGAVRAVELRLASGAIDAKQAADRLDKLLYVWRGDQRERMLREHLAELRARSGAWRTALALLRETEAIFPSDKAAIHAELADMFATLLRGDAAESLAPLELAALAEENADLLPTGAEGEALQARLADRLLALDLPKRAGPVLEKLMQAAPTDVGRASFGARLAALRLRETDVAGAFAALSASAVPDLPAELTERRTLLLSAAHARRSDTDRALATLESLDTAAADEARATIQERANDWPAAERALTEYAAKSVPREGKLDDGQRRTLLRLATAAARAGDEPALTALRQREGPRMATGPLADMFRLLTADPVRSVADLKRSGQEAAMARGLPGQLKALQPAPRQTQ
jgi:hypothetical protein